MAEGLPRTVKSSGLGPSGPSASVHGAATGLLIPQLARSVPRSLKYQSGGEPIVLRELVALGILSLQDEANDAVDLIELGMGRMIDGLDATTDKRKLGTHTQSKTALGRYDDEFGDMAQIFFAKDGKVSLLCWDRAVEVRLEVKPILDRIGLNTSAAKWAIRLINQHNGFGTTASWAWNIKDMGAGKQSEDGDWIDEDEKAGKDSDKSVAAERKLWIDKLQAQHPWLFRMQHSEKLIDIFNRDVEQEAAASLRHIKRRDKELADIFEGLVATIGMKEPGTEPFAVLTWTSGDHTDHAWDYITHCIHEGYYDSSQNSLIDTGSMTVRELKSALDDIERWLSPVSRLVEWSYATNRVRKS